MTDPRPCIVCGTDLTPTQPQTCTPCVADIRRDLARIDHLYAALPALLGRPDGATLGAVMGGHTDETNLPGGDILAMLGPGSATGEGQWSDPPAVAAELATWVEDWRSIRDERGRWYATVPDCVAYLSARAGWAGDHHPAFDELASDLARIVHRLEAVTATSDAPERGPDCPYCGATLHRGWTDHGADDDWACPACRRAFNHDQYRLALRGALDADAARRAAS